MNNNTNHINVAVILFLASSFKLASAHHIEYIIQFITINSTQARDAINVKYCIIFHKNNITSENSFGTQQYFSLQ
jgi:hypothetical protein